MQKRGRRKSNLASALAGVATPVYAVDHRRRIVFFNTGCERLTGCTADEIVGRTCEYRTDGETDLERLVNTLCPPPAAFSGDRVPPVPVFLPRRGGPNATRRLVPHPLVEEDGRVPLVVVFIEELPQSTTSDTRTPATTRLHAELAAARAALRRRYGRDTILGRGPAMQRVLDQIDLASRTNSPLLFVGARGSGRTHAARVVHVAASTAVRQIVPLDCAALDPRELKHTLKRLLHGEHEGPVTGLQPGTLLLQNVDALPRELQELVTDAYAVEESVLARPRPRLAATMESEPIALRKRDVLTDEFFFLLTRFPIRLPTLLERPEDLEPLAVAFLEETNRGVDRQVVGFTDDVWTRFRRYHWPGNVGELRLVVRAARESTSSELIQSEDLPFGFRAGLESRAIGPPKRAKPCELDPLLERVESEQIRLALAEGRFNKSRAAELLGITRARLYRRMEQLGIADGPATGDNDAETET